MSNCAIIVVVIHEISNNDRRTVFLVGMERGASITTLGAFCYFTAPMTTVDTVLY